MAKNDVVLIDKILKDLDTNNDIGVTFENFATEQLLKEYDLSEEEILSGIVDGKDDGGIDGIFYFVNSRLISDIEKIDFPKTGIDFSIYIITCKHEDSFKMVPINTISTTLDEFFDFTIDSKNLISSYNLEIIEKRELLINIYSKIASKLDNFKINIVYASRGDMNELADNVRSKAKYLSDSITKKFSFCNTEFHFLGSAELLEKYRKRKIMSSEIKCIDIINCENSYLMLCNLKDYFNFVIDDEKKLRRYFLDSNVRAYMGDNRVNSEIMKTLVNKDSVEFWFLNNGITILSNKVAIIGKRAIVENVQIVNGLQTTETIYNYFSKLTEEKDESRNILIKIIESDDNQVRDEIIKSTNNQTTVELYSLKATDKIQRDIEDILLKNDLYYERRVNHYLNQGVEKTKIITPLYLAYGYVSLVLKIPHKSITLKSKFMNVKEQYEKVFSEQIPIEVWPIIAIILKKVERIVEEERKNYTMSTSKYLKIMRSTVSFLVTSKVLGKFNFSLKELIGLDVSLLSDELILNVFNQINEIETDFKNIRSQQRFIQICDEFAKCNNIHDIKSISNRSNPFYEPLIFNLDEDFIQSVKEKLPPQPWPVGTYTKIAKTMGEFTPKVSQAVHTLVSRGDFYEQRKGVLYDKNGKVVELEN